MGIYRGERSSNSLNKRTSDSDDHASLVAPTTYSADTCIESTVKLEIPSRGVCPPRRLHQELLQYMTRTIGLRADLGTDKQDFRLPSLVYSHAYKALYRSFYLGRASCSVSDCAYIVIRRSWYQARTSRRVVVTDIGVIFITYTYFQSTLIHIQPTPPTQPRQRPHPLSHDSTHTHQQCWW
jgi:hypothetical protein